MTLQEFNSSIEGKYFIELDGLAVSSFVALTDEGTTIRNSATTAGVLVFLKSINQIFARGTYYGIKPDDWTTLSNRIGALEDVLNNLQPPLGELAALVQTNQTNIAANAAAIEANAKILNGDPTVVVPNDPTDPDYTAAKNEHDGLLLRVTDIEGQISAITGNTGGLSQAVNALVDARIETIFGQNAGQRLSDLETALSNKAAQSDFSALIGKIGRASGENQNDIDWDVTNNGGTIITVINNLRQTTQTLTTNVSSLQTQIGDLLPKFDIEVVSKDQTTELPNVANPSPHTIYLVLTSTTTPDGDQNDLFTEYIWIDKNTDPNESSSYAWEKIGQQSLNMSNIDPNALESITTQLVEYIENLQSSLDDAKIAQITTNANNITAIQTTISSIQTSLNSLIQNGELQFTGEDIKTTTAGSTTIAGDIATLQSNKLDKDTLNWVVINQNISNS